jgi:hypothetical protein
MNVHAHLVIGQLQFNSLQQMDPFVPQIDGYEEWVFCKMLHKI